MLFYVIYVVWIGLEPLPTPEPRDPHGLRAERPGALLGLRAATGRRRALEAQQGSQVGKASVSEANPGGCSKIFTFCWPFLAFFMPMSSISG